jgi:hypothetical protein
MDIQHDERQKEMSDIVERLRYWGKSFSLGMEAADEIERLRAALQWLLNDLQDYPASARPVAAYDNARAALGEKE